MKDRLLSGFYAGLAGGIVMDFFNLASHYAHLGNLRYLDWMSVILYGRFSASSLEAAFAQAAHLLWTGLLGIGMAYLIPLATSRNYLFRGWIYGIASWILVYAVTIFFKMPGVRVLNFPTVFGNFLGATEFGLTAAYVLYRLDNPVSNR